MAAEDFIVELGCAELPPKALRPLSEAFHAGVVAGLEKAGLRFERSRAYATPRRLAILIDGLQTHQADTAIERFGPAVQAAFDAEGKATPAASGFARSCGISVDELAQAEKDGTQKLVYRATRQGEAAASLLPGIVQHSLGRLPIPRRMRWGSSREEFVRPVYWVLMLLGDTTLDCNILGINAGRETFGHRFHSPDAIRLERPADYEQSLQTAFVIADHDKRKQLISQQVQAQGEALGAHAVIEDDLLEEVCSLVEWPVAITGRFDKAFLKVPSEALVSSLKNHQKCFYVLDGKQQMLPNFITVSNIESRDPAMVVAGNERVIRPRLADAAFFYDTDRKTPLIGRLDALKSIVFQQQLGTLHDKSQRVADLASVIADSIGGNKGWCHRAALLAKCDLVTEMVLEFAELQGIMGYYYARHDGEAEEVATALNEQYMPRFAGDQLPQTQTGAILAIADKLDTMVGLFAIGQPPTGSKDPFALRRAALGVLRIVVEKSLSLDLREALAAAVNAYRQQLPDIAPDTEDQVFEFLLERFRAWYQAEGVSADVFQSVFELRPTRPLDFSRRIHAVHHFAALPEATALSAANKRVANILQKQVQAQLPALDKNLLEAPAEIELAALIEKMTAEVDPLFAAGDYTSGLEKLASTRASVDRFFDEVMVMVDDSSLRNNRLALVRQLRRLFLQVADISCLHGG